MSGSFDDEEPDTLPPCLACGGEWQRVTEKNGVEYRVMCRWCIRGGMTPDQIKRWNSRPAKK